MILSGGQTGVDRAALDFAIQHAIPHGGWCPRGRMAEDGPLDLRYQLHETPSTSYAQRTEWNIRDTDATVIFSATREVTGGTRLTVNIAARLNKPLLHITAAATAIASAAALQGFLDVYRVQKLNVAGPRASQTADLESLVREVLGLALLKRAVA